MPSLAKSNAVEGNTETAANDAALLMTAAFERIKAKAAALPASDLLDIRVPVGDMVQTIIGSLPQLRERRADLERAGDCDMAHLDNLEDYVYALGYLYSRVREANGKPSIKTVEQLMASRQVLHAHATALAYSGFFDREKVVRLNRGKSYQDLAYDIVGITNLFLESWSALEDNTIVTRPQLVQAQASATALIRTLGEREQNPGERAELNQVYRQVYTLTYVAYNELRDALAYARRREKDAADIAPSLHEDQGRRRSVSESLPTPDDTDDGENEVAAIAVAQGNGTSPVGRTTTTSDVVPAGGQAVARPGFPGAPSVLGNLGEA